MPKRIVILGGGYAGVLTAKKLARKLKKNQVEITLIDKNPFHTLLTELHEVAAGRVEESAVRVPFAKIFAGRKVEVVLDQILSADLAGKKLRGKAGSIATTTWWWRPAPGRPTSAWTGRPGTPCPSGPMTTPCVSGRGCGPASGRRRASPMRTNGGASSPSAWWGPALPAPRWRESWPSTSPFSAGSSA